MLSVKQETVTMPTRDGVCLAADIYRPQSRERFPVLLMRQPYGKAIASTVVYGHPHWYAAQGYIVVIQDVRGRGSSAGEFRLFEHEIADGADTLAWAAQLPGSTGQVGMYGFSYQGMTQLYAAIGQGVLTASSTLRAICPAMLAYDLYQDWAYENGAFCWQSNLNWAIQLAAETARLRGDASAFQQLRHAARQLPLGDRIPVQPHILQTLAPESFYHDWLAHSDPDDPYWRSLSPSSWLGEIDLPMLHIGGWFDPYLRGTLKLYRAMERRSHFPQRLIVGPWGHLPWGRTLGAKDYGPAAISPVDHLQIAWFDHFLKGTDAEWLDHPPVQLFEMGTNQWRYVEQFPQPQAHRECLTFYLTSDGLASMREDSGQLVVVPAKATMPDNLVHDPWRPVPARGGHGGSPAGSWERSEIDARSDVLTYTSEPLDEALRIVGVGWVELDCHASASSYDLCAIVSEVKPDGQVFNITQGYKRLDTSQSPVKIPLQATCLTLAKGDRLRLSLSATAYPAYPVNPGTGTLATQATLIEAQVITITVNAGKSMISTLRLPTGHHSTQHSTLESRADWRP